MRFGRGGFGWRGEFDKIEVSEYADVDPATVTVTGSANLARSQTISASVVVAGSIQPLAWTIDLGNIVVYFDSGWIEISPGDAIDFEGEATATVSSVVVTSGSWAAEDAAGYLILTDFSGGLDPYPSLWITIVSKKEIGFYNGSVAAIQVGETVTDQGTGATGIVEYVHVDSGSWVGGDAAGYIVCSSLTGTFVASNTMIGQTSGSSSTISYFSDSEVALTTRVSDPQVRLPAVMYYQDIDWLIVLPHTAVTYIVFYNLGLSTVPDVGDVIKDYYDHQATISEIVVFTDGGWADPCNGYLVITGYTAGFNDEVHRVIYDVTKGTVLIAYHYADPETAVISDRIVFPFVDGSIEIQADDSITLDGSGVAATAHVTAVELTSGSWAEGDAAGTLEIDSLIGQFSGYFGYAHVGTAEDPVCAAVWYPRPDLDRHTAVVAPSKEALWTLVPVVDTVTGLPVVPTAQIFIPPSSSPLTGVTAWRKLSDKMMLAQFDYEGTEIGDAPNTYFKHVSLQIPDKDGVNQTVFVGFFPSGKATLAAEGDREVLSAYDYAYYLTMNRPDFADKVLLTPEDQAGTTTYRLYYMNVLPYLNLNVGEMLYGETSGDYGLIIAEGFEYARYVDLQNPTGEFQDGENLMVGSVIRATADGHAVDITGTVIIDDPVSYVTRLLGGTNYERVTGIYPYRMTPVNWSSSSDPPAIEFRCEDKETKISIIERICRYIRYIFFIKSIELAGVYYCAAYMIPEANIDSPTNGLDLPAAVTITDDDDYLLSPGTHERKGEERYNQVRVRCQAAYGANVGQVFEAILPEGGYVAGDPILEYYEMNPNLASQAECNQRCADLYAYYVDQIESYELTFLERSDFRLLQKLVFSGHSKITSGTYRIVSISYDYRQAGLINDVTVSIIPDSQFQFWLNLNRIFTDSLTEIQNLVRAELDKLGVAEVGTATDVTDGVVKGEMEDGQTKSSRDAS